MHKVFGQPSTRMCNLIFFKNTKLFMSFSLCVSLPPWTMSYSLTRVTSARWLARKLQALVLPWKYQRINNICTKAALWEPIKKLQQPNECLTKEKKPTLKTIKQGTSLEVQWLRLHLPKNKNIKQNSTLTNLIKKKKSVRHLGHFCSPLLYPFLI